MERSNTPDGVTNLGGYGEQWWNTIQKNRGLIWEYNSIIPTNLKRRYEILQELLGQSDQTTIIEPPFRCDNGPNIFLGKKFYANYNLTILDWGKVTIGDQVIVGPNVTIIAAGHYVHPEERYSDDTFPLIPGPVTIGDRVWIGANVVIQMGVTIGYGSVIGAGSVVTKDIPENTVAAGVPCKVLRTIDDSDRAHRPE